MNNNMFKKRHIARITHCIVCSVCVVCVCRLEEGSNLQQVVLMMMKQVLHKNIPVNHTVKCKCLHFCCITLQGLLVTARRLCAVIDRALLNNAVLLLLLLIVATLPFNAAL